MHEDDVALPIVLRFTLTREEERVSTLVLRHRYERDAGGALVWAIYLGAIPVGLAGGLVAIAFGVDASRSGALVATLIGIAYLIGYHLSSFTGNAVRRRLAAKTKRDLSNLEAERVLSIDDTGIAVSWGNSKGFRSWQDVTELTKGRGLLIFWSGYESGIVLPRRVLPDVQAATVLRLAQEHIRPRP